MAENSNPEGKNAIVLREEEIQKFWQENNIFQKSLEKPSPKGEFVFYDGPPFATGLPHFGHILPGTIKDVIPRFKTMQGYHVPRRWGWDCHGLPIENLVEKELGLKSKKDIEDLGIETFNEAARASVFRYDADWKKLIPRSGRWVDMDHAYLTMDPTYTESIWWSFKTLHEKELVYKAFKVMFLCPHCGTTLSNFEVSQGYKDITDISAYVKFELVEEPGTFLIAWTTTPWTLPGNVALAVNPEIEYVKIKARGEKEDGSTTGTFIVAKARLDAIAVLIKGQYEIEKTLKASDLLGKKYKPVFDYYKNADLTVAGKPLGNAKTKESLYKIVAADFVTAADGTGIVHIAPAFGEEDYALSFKEKLPFIQHVGMDGTFKKEVTEFAGMSVKPKDSAEEPNAHQKADIEMIKHLTAQGKLFGKEKIIHSYPHCWRCDTPLLNYATDSWFVEVTKIKDKLIKENKKVAWMPEEVGDGRFGKWLENARDWAVSRSRYWGAPLPIWVCDTCEKREVIGSIQELKEKTRRNNYILMRHGESEANVQGVINIDQAIKSSLTQKGIKEVEKTAASLKKKKIDLIFSSPLERCKQTAEIVARDVGYVGNVEIDDRLREVGATTFNGKTWKERAEQYDSRKDFFTKDVFGDENLESVKKRFADFLYDIDQKYIGKTILVVSHGSPISSFQSIADGQTLDQVLKIEYSGPVPTATAEEVVFSQISHNRAYELDLHRPYIDAVSWKCAHAQCNGTFKRIPEVFDTWYESGSMPYASRHYLGKPLAEFRPKSGLKSSINFPANFIAEGQDQTRGWFYSLLVLSTGLFGQSPYEHVVVNGTVLAEDGQKMSKRLKNYPDIADIFDKYGADALRYFLMASPAVKAEDIMFSEKSLDEVLKKLTQRVWNVCSFYEIYKTESAGIAQSGQSKNVLDRWIISRLNELTAEVTRALEAYEMDKTARPLLLFVDDLSTWYLRRSRDRFKSKDAVDKQNALSTIRFVLEEFSKLLAPFMPFLAEDIYFRVKTQAGKESVHLEVWPRSGSVDQKILEEMASVRKAVSLALEARAKAGLKVRQPLAELRIREKNLEGDEELLSLIKHEVNVKRVLIDHTITADIEFDSFIVTPELQEEGNVRELTRFIQDLRKKAELHPSDKIMLFVETDVAGKKLIEKYKADIMKTTNVAGFEFKNTEGDIVTILDLSFKISLNKIPA